MLGNTAEAYFSPALIKMSDYLRLSPNVAGVTLLALGNGAPDLSTIIIGVFKGSAEIGFGAPIGGGSFQSLIVNMHRCVCNHFCVWNCHVGSRCKSYPKTILARCWILLDISRLFVLFVHGQQSKNL